MVFLVKFFFFWDKRGGRRRLGFRFRFFSFYCGNKLSFLIFIFEVSCDGSIGL